MTVVFIFPGQNSRYPTMIDKLVDAEPDLAAVLRQASDVLGRDLRAQYRADDKAAFARNRDVQIGVFLANYLWAELLRQRGVGADLSLGLSLGEYNHLVDIGALDFEQAVRLLEARGVAFENSPDGAMAAAFPISEEDALEIVGRVGAGDRLAAAMRNAPRQQVFSGDRKAVDEACRIAEDEHFIQPVVIDNRLPMHSPLFHSVAQEFGPALEAVQWRQPSKPYIPNATAEVMAAPTAEDFRTRLSEHLHQPVLWRRSIDRVCADFEDAVFVEVGPKTVLSDMLGRRWVSRPVMATDGDFPVLGQLNKIQEVASPCNRMS
jgi:[acyl-carrier-protein] S-malonyltransferase